MSFPTSITDHPIVQEAVHRLDDLATRAPVRH